MSFPSLAISTLLAFCLRLRFAVAIRSRSRQRILVDAATTPPAPIFTRINHVDIGAIPHKVDTFQGSRGSFSASPQHPSRGTEVSRRHMVALLAGRSNSSVVVSRHRYGSTTIGDADEIVSPSAVSRLADLDGSLYIGSLGIGTKRGLHGKVMPESELRVLYDTGSADFWVASDLCSRGPCAQRSRKYNHSRSETFMVPDEDIEITTAYASGQIKGFRGVDDVFVGPFLVRQQALGLISEEEGDAFERLPFDGVVGLGFPSSAVTSNATLFDSLVQQGLLPRHEFAFYFHPNRAVGGAILWGGHDDRFFQKPLVWYPVVEEGLWAIELVAFKVGNRSFEAVTGADVKGSLQGLQADAHDEPPSWHQIEQASPFNPLLIVDTGTTFFSATGDVYAAISDATYPMECDAVGRLPSLAYTLRDSEGQLHEVVVPPEEYMVRSDTAGEMCIPGVMEMADDLEKRSLMIFGEVFMRYYFTVFRRGGVGSRPYVGIARAAHGIAAQFLFAESQAHSARMAIHS